MRMHCFISKRSNHDKRVKKANRNPLEDETTTTFPTYNNKNIDNRCNNNHLHSNSPRTTAKLNHTTNPLLVTTANHRTQTVNKHNKCNNNNS